MPSVNKTHQRKAFFHLLQFAQKIASLLKNVHMHHKQKQQSKNRTNKENQQNKPKQNILKVLYTASVQLILGLDNVCSFSIIMKHYPSMCTLHELERKYVHNNAFLTTHRPFVIHLMYLQFNHFSKKVSFLYFGFPLPVP